MNEILNDEDSYDDCEEDVLCDRDDMQEMRDISGHADDEVLRSPSS